MGLSSGLEIRDDFLASGKTSLYPSVAGFAASVKPNPGISTILSALLRSIHTCGSLDTELS
jgi:hypothetical protein